MLEEEQNLEYLQERERSVAQLEADIGDVNQIFKDLAAMVHDQVLMRGSMKKEKSSLFLSGRDGGLDRSQRGECLHPGERGFRPASHGGEIPGETCRAALSCLESSPQLWASFPSFFIYHLFPICFRRRWDNHSYPWWHKDLLLIFFYFQNKARRKKMCLAGTGLIVLIILIIIIASAAKNWTLHDYVSSFIHFLQKTSHTGQEQACSRITWLSFVRSSPCRKWPNTEENGCWLPPSDHIQSETLFQTRQDQGKEWMVQPVFCIVDAGSCYFPFLLLFAKISHSQFT